MRKRVLIAALALITSLLAACSTDSTTVSATIKAAPVVVDGLVISADTKGLMDQYPVVRDLIRAKLPDFAPQAANKLQAIGQALDALHADMQDAGGGIVQALSGGSQVFTGYQAARPLYREAREILGRNAHLFGDWEWAMFERFDRLAMDLDRRLQRHLTTQDGADYSYAVNDALFVVGTLADLLAPPRAHPGVADAGQCYDSCHSQAATGAADPTDV